MAKISLCMIVKNEEDFIENAISSVLPIVDEVIVVDTGSKDNTKQLAEDLGAKVIVSKWSDDFSKSRNESIKHATGDWILVIDADESIGENDLKKLKKLADSKDVNAYLFTQRTYTNDSKLKEWTPIIKSTKETKGFSGWVPAKVIRMFKNTKGVKFEGLVHETVKNSIERTNGKILETEVPIHHYGMLKPTEKKSEKDKLYLKLGKKKAKSGDAKSFYELGKQFVEIGNANEALKSFEEALIAKPDYTDVYVDMGILFMKVGKMKEAKKSFARAINLNTKSPDAFNNLGIIYGQMGMHDDAVLLFLKAIELKSDFAAAYMNMGLSLDAQGKKKDAGICFSAAIKLNPKYKEQVSFE